MGVSTCQTSVEKFLLDKNKMERPLLLSLSQHIHTHTLGIRLFSCNLIHTPLVIHPMRLGRIDLTRSYSQACMHTQHTHTRMHTVQLHMLREIFPLLSHLVPQPSLSLSPFLLVTMEFCKVIACIATSAIHYPVFELVT